MPMSQSRYYTTDEFFKITQESDERLELRNGEIVAMSSPNTIHQRLIKRLTSIIDSYIIGNNGVCEVFPAPYDIKLDDYNVVIPDISIICDQSKIDSKRCNGAPDWIIEVVSSNYRDDYIRKLSLYEKFRVREYWIVDPQKHTTFVYLFEEMREDIDIVSFYDFSQSVPVSIYKDRPVQLEITIAKLLEL